MRVGQSPYIHGFHEIGGERLDRVAPGWRTWTVELGHSSGPVAGGDFRLMSNLGYGTIVRLNHGYGEVGTIPLRTFYARFAERVGRYVAASRGCHIWQIGNEPNHEQERPNGVPIRWQSYVECFRGCYQRIKEVQPDSIVLPAPIAPWNNQTGDWLAYQREMIAQLQRERMLDGLSLHAYTHGAHPGLVDSWDRDAHGWLWHFNTYQEQIHNVRVECIPIFITESNQGDDPWLDANSGWVEAVYANVDRWNQNHPTQVVRAVCLYRWPQYDKWYIEGKAGVEADYSAAVARRYRWAEEEPPPVTGELQNPSLEHPYTPRHRDNQIVAEGWEPWDAGAKWPEQHPGHELKDAEYKPLEKAQFDYRVIDGATSQCFFATYGVFHGGLYQVIPDVPPGEIEFQLPAAGWCNDDDDPMGTSNDQIYGRVGIDLEGDTGPFGNVIWGNWGWLQHGFEPLIVKAMHEQAGPITVFLHCWNKYARKHNDVIVDAATLTVETGPEPPEPPPPGGSGQYAMTGVIEIPIKIEFLGDVQGRIDALIRGTIQGTMEEIPDE